MRKMNFLLAFLCGLTLIGSPAFAADETYPIKLVRIAKAGDVSDVHRTVEQTRSMTMKRAGAAPQAQDQAMKGDLTARETIVAGGEDGKATEVSLAVTKFVDVDGKELIPAGKVAQIKMGEKETTVTIERATVAENVRALLAVMYSPHKPGATDDDSVFGSKTPRKVGESWPLDATAAADDLSKSVAKVDAKDISGQVTLAGVEKTAAGDALKITSEFKAKNMVPPLPAEGFTVNQCDVDVHVDGLFPTDLTKPRTDAMMSMDMTMQLVSKDGSISIAMKMHQTQKTSLTPIKK